VHPDRVGDVAPGSAGRSDCTPWRKKTVLLLHDLGGDFEDRDRPLVAAI